MNAHELRKKLDSSMNMKLIVAGLAGLVEEEGYSPHEAFRILESIKNNTFHALVELRSESK